MGSDLAMLSSKAKSQQKYPSPLAKLVNIGDVSWALNKRPDPRKTQSKATVVISPTHKRTEGRAPCGALSLLQKDAALQGGIQQKPL